MTALLVTGARLKGSQSSRPSSSGHSRPKSVHSRVPTPWALNPKSSSASRPSSARPSTEVSRSMANHRDFLDRYNLGADRPRTGQRPATAGNRRGTSSTPKKEQRPLSAQSAGSVRPEFVFKKPAMRNMAEWMATEADNSERRDFKKVHELLSIETAGGHQPSVAVAFAPAPEAQSEGEADPALEELNAGLNAITMQCWRDNLRTTYQDQFTHGGPVMQIADNRTRTKHKVWELLGTIVNDEALEYVTDQLQALPSNDASLVWKTLQKLAANEVVIREPKESTTSATHTWNPFYKKPIRRTDYPNLSTALPLDKTFYPPGMKAPPPVTSTSPGLARRSETHMHDPKFLSQMTMNMLTVGSTAQDDFVSPPATPESQEKEQYYGHHKCSYGAEGGPNTTYTCLLYTSPSPRDS
eukprot:TRINITY_DN22770_c0_g2_i2.p1 TRINITY_DN22770_c0_g2~~TRINITY_DN22770_c0_g2_i2.p1  ORF type:complete len:412 (+),score=81.72 TRINITY_DN22770_c0_g2_i2:237-1472(+)